MKKFALVIHIYYLELFTEIIVKLKLLNLVDFDIYVSCQPSIESAVIEIANQYSLQISLVVCENKGRDVLPFIQTLKIIYNKNYKVLLKIHTKKSPHREDGDLWRNTILSSLLNVDSFQKIISNFESNANIGLIAPEMLYTPVMHYFESNEDWLDKICSQLDCSKEVLKTLDFPAGTMFFCRPDALKKLYGVSWDNLFEEEFGQLDGTLAHAIERIIPALVLDSGLGIFSITKSNEILKHKAVTYSDWMISMLRAEITSCWDKIKLLQIENQKLNSLLTCQSNINQVNKL